VATSQKAIVFTMQLVNVDFTISDIGLVKVFQLKFSQNVFLSYARENF
jgi:hypothetical protein